MNSAETCHFKAAAFCLNQGVIKNRIRYFPLGQKKCLFITAVFFFFLEEISRSSTHLLGYDFFVGKLLNTTKAVACENSRFSPPEEKRMFSLASCKLSFPPSPLAHAFSWGSLLSVSLLASFIVRMPMGQVLLAYSYFEKGCRKKCTQQPWKVLWAVLSSLFFQRNLKEWQERPWTYICEC